MVKTIVELWEENKDKLAEKIKLTNQSDFSYKWFVENIARIILDIKQPKIHQIDDGDYQGTLLFIFCDYNIYQPCIRDYYLTSVEYGSCSFCDTLEGIRKYDGNLPNDKQIKDYMTLCLHLIQKMKKFDSIDYISEN